jgi:hypothetical protein
VEPGGEKKSIVESDNPLPSDNDDGGQRVIPLILSLDPADLHPQLKLLQYRDSFATPVPPNRAGWVCAILAVNRKTGKM